MKELPNRQIALKSASDEDHKENESQDEVSNMCFITIELMY